MSSLGVVEVGFATFGLFGYTDLISPARTTVMPAMMLSRVDCFKSKARFHSTFIQNSQKHFVKVTLLMELKKHRR